MSGVTNYYDILGISKDATQDDIKKAFKKKCRESHPDRFSDMKIKKQKEEEFKQINNAYETLSDSQSRAQYDAGFGGAETAGGGYRSNSDFGSGFGSFYNRSNDDMSNFSDIFDEIFGNSRKSKKNHSTAGGNKKLILEIDIKEAYLGCFKNITLQYKAKCQPCSGTGSKDHIKHADCSMCQGSGSVHRNQGFIITTITCPQCSGTGIDIKNKCKTCIGEGRHNQYIKLNINIPAGVSTGHKITLSGKGEAGIRGGKAGDLFISLKIKPSKEFELHNSDIYKEIYINMLEAGYGTEITTKTIDDDEITIRIPKGIQDKGKLKIAKRGFSIYDSSNRGDMYLIVHVKMLDLTTTENKKLLEKFLSNS